MQSFYARSAKYAHKNGFRLIVKMMSKRNVIAPAVFEQFVENLISQHARTLLRRISVFLAKSRNVHRIRKKFNSALLTEFFYEKTVLDALFTANSVFDVDCNDFFSVFQKCMKKRNGISSAAKRNAYRRVAFYFRPFKKRRNALFNA